MFPIDGIACRRGAGMARSDHRGGPLEGSSMTPDTPNGRGTSRRGLIQGAGGVAFVGASLAALKLPFFATAGAQQDPAQCRATDTSASDKDLVVSNWPAYIDPKKKSTSTLQVFEDRTGNSVSYTDDVNDNAEFYAKVKNQLASCQPINRDMIILTDWDGGPDDRPGLDPAAGRGQGAQPAQEPHRAAAEPPVGPQAAVPRTVAERADGHRLQRVEDPARGQL